MELEPKAFYLLEFLILNRQRVVSKEEIFGVVWRDVVVTDNALTRVVTQIRKALDDDPRNPRFIETIPKVGYRFTAAIESPAGRLPGDESSTTTDSASTGRSVLSGLRTHALLIGLLGCVAAVTLIVVLHRREAAAATRIHAVAVLPFENLSGDSQQNYLADGMTDELITMLARNSTLRIVSRTSVMQYKGSTRPLAEIARSLNVGGVIEGSVVRSGDNVHLTAQLVGVPNDTLLWAQSYDRSSADSVRLAPDIALAVARRLQSVVAKPAEPRPVNAAAHDAYLRGRYFWFRYKNGEAGKYFRQATELQPDYALAWSGLAGYFGVGAVGGFQDPRASVPQSKAAALEAVQLDDSLPDAHFALGLAYLAEWNISAAQSEIARTIQLNPSMADVYHLRARVETALNRNAEAIQAQRTAMELDPFERPWGMVWTLKTVRQYDAAIQEAQQRLEALPNDDSIYWELGQVYDRKGDKDKAVQAWEKMELAEGHTANAANIRNVYQRGGWTALIKSFLADDEKASASSYVSPFDLARYYAELDEREKTLQLLEEAFSQRSPQLLWIQTDPAFDFLHQDTRYQALVQQLGIPLVGK